MTHNNEIYSFLLPTKIVIFLRNNFKESRKVTEITLEKCQGKIVFWSMQFYRFFYYKQEHFMCAFMSFLRNLLYIKSSVNNVNYEKLFKLCVKFSKINQLSPAWKF